MVLQGEERKNKKTKNKRSTSPMEQLLNYQKKFQLMNLKVIIIRGYLVETSIPIQGKGVPTKG